MRIDILTIFPGMFGGPFDESIVARARARGLLDLHVHDIRPFAMDRHRTTDAAPYGGGAGMVMRPEPIFAAAERVISEAGEEPAVILMTPQGRLFNQRIAREMSKRRHLLLICGHYEGFDERVREHLATDELSIGDYVLTGGELPAMVVVDAVTRLLPGTIGSEASLDEESHAAGLLEYPHYTRPAEFKSWTVPDVLLSGNHGDIALWRREQSLLRTLRRRPELLETAVLSSQDRRFLASIGEPRFMRPEDAPRVKPNRRSRATPDVSDGQVDRKW